MDVHRVGVKLFCEGEQQIKLVDFIPVFHRWIQARVLDDLLIDVADYSHLPEGPGIVLVGHGGNLAIDETGGRRGLVYWRKQPLGGDLGGRLRTILGYTAKAAARLEAETEVSGRQCLSAAEVLFVSNDRLLGPNTDTARAELEIAVGELAADVYKNDGPFELIPGARDARERLSVVLKVSAAPPVADLAARLDG